MICRNCKNEMEKPRLGGLCISCEEKEKKDKARRDKITAAVIIIVITCGVGLSASWAIMKFLAVVKYVTS